MPEVPKTPLEPKILEAVLSNMHIQLKITLNSGVFDRVEENLNFVTKDIAPPLFCKFLPPGPPVDRLGWVGHSKASFVNCLLKRTNVAQDGTQKNGCRILCVGEHFRPLSKKGQVSKQRLISASSKARMRM